MGFEIGAEGLPIFNPAAEVSIPLGDVSVPEAETTGAREALLSCLDYLRGEMRVDLRSGCRVLEGPAPKRARVHPPDQ